RSSGLFRQRQLSAYQNPTGVPLRLSNCLWFSPEFDEPSRAVKGYTSCMKTYPQNSPAVDWTAFSRKAAGSPAPPSKAGFATAASSGDVESGLGGSLESATAAFWTSRAVAQLLGVTVRTVCLWAELGEIPAFRFRRQWRFRPADLRLWLDRKRNAAAIDE